jgi:hypothetical protein
MIMALLCGSGSSTGKENEHHFEKSVRRVLFRKTGFSNRYTQSLSSLSCTQVGFFNRLVVEPTKCLCMLSKVLGFCISRECHSTDFITVTVQGIEICAVFVVCSFNVVFVVYNKHTTVRCSHLFVEFSTGPRASGERSKIYLHKA